jgi:hypothetical protein
MARDQKKKKPGALNAEVREEPSLPLPSKNGGSDGPAPPAITTGKKTGQLPPALPPSQTDKLPPLPSSETKEPPPLPVAKSKEPPPLPNSKAKEPPPPPSSEPKEPPSLASSKAKEPPKLFDIDDKKPSPAKVDEEAETVGVLDQPPNPSLDSQPDTPSRRVARRRPTGPARHRVAANDDAPSMGGLIYALQQKPSSKPYKIAGIASLIWGAIGIAFIVVMIRSQPDGMSFIQIVFLPTTFLTTAAIVVPIAVLWFLALLAWRAEELRLRSSTMTEVAVRLAEPEKMAGESIASLGQAVRRQVSFMNDAVSRALGRAGELEALVHNEVAVLERSYEDNERKIRGLIQELSGERHALVNTSDRVAGTLRDLGSEIPTLIDKLSDQQIKLSHIVQGAGQNLTALETTIASSVGALETSLGGGTEKLQNVLETYTGALAGALDSRSAQMQQTLEGYMEAFDSALARRAQALDYQLVERTKSLDDAFTERLRLFDDSIMRSTAAIDSAVDEKAKALTTALAVHATTFRDTIGKQSADLDDALTHGINAVRRSSENITHQSVKAMEGLAGQSELLRNVSDNVLGQINSVTSRFENQGQMILKAANSLEGANFKIDSTLRNRHAELSSTLDRLSGKAEEFGQFIEVYSSSIEGSISDAETRARGELERMRVETSAEGERALEDLKQRLTSVSGEMTSELGSLSSQVATSSEELRQQAARAAEQVAAEQARLREQMEQLPITTHESTNPMRLALQDQLSALDQLSQLTSRTAMQRDVNPPSPIEDRALAQGARPPAGQPKPPPRETTRALSSLSSTITQEMGNRQRQQRPRPTGKKSGRGRGDAREGWSLGDLLARASRDEDGSPQAAGAAQPTQTFNLDLPTMARVLDAATAAAIWSRLRAGHRGVMARSIYGDEGHALFDEVSHRCQTDANLAQTIRRYLADFERAIAESDLSDSSGRLTQSHLISDTGRVYLFLAHACGRIQ